MRLHTNMPTRVCYGSLHVRDDTSLVVAYVIGRGSLKKAEIPILWVLVGAGHEGQGASTIVQ